MNNRKKMVLLGSIILGVSSMGALASAWFFYPEQNEVTVSSNDIILNTKLYSIDEETQTFTELVDESSNAVHSVAPLFTFTEWHGSFICEGRSKEYYLMECTSADVLSPSDYTGSALFDLSLSSTKTKTKDFDSDGEDETYYVWFKLANLSYAYVTDQTLTASGLDASYVNSLTYTDITFTGEEENYEESEYNYNSSYGSDLDLNVDSEDSDVCLDASGHIHFFVFLKVTADESGTVDTKLNAFNITGDSFDITNSFKVSAVLRTKPYKE